MLLNVQYSAAAQTNISYSISAPQFVRYFVLAGAGFSPRADYLRRGLGALAWYWDFIEPIANGYDHFGEPALILRDPTLKAHFSNLTGRAFADFLAQQLEGAVITRSYEGVMLQQGLPIIGTRPDLLALGLSRVVALEAKGYAKHSVSTNNMVYHKLQAQQGPLPRHSWAASVAYSLYY